MLKDLVQISQSYGKNQEYVIAGGGNTSCKDQNYLWIKASGTSLATIQEDGFAKMDRNCLKQLAEKKYSEDPLKREAEIKEELQNCIAGDKSKRPSVETSLHNLLEYKFIVHTHPTLVNGLMCAKNSKSLTKELFGGEALYVEYTDPGYILFKLVEKRINEYRVEKQSDPKIIFLENHGVFVSADTTEEINRIYDNIKAKISDGLSSPLPSIQFGEAGLEQEVKMLQEKTGLIVKSYSSDLIDYFTEDSNRFSQVSTAFTPDNIVYCKAHYPFVVGESSDITSEYENFNKKYGYPPRVMGIEGKGIICIEENEKSVNTVAEVFVDILKISKISENFGGPRFMTARQIEFIDNWEVENYRRKVAKM